MAKRGLTPTEMERIAEERLLQDLVGDILDVCRQENRQLAETIEAEMAEYRDMVRNECADPAEEGDLESMFRCIEEQKKRTDTRDAIREQLRRM
jgi:hypothetical protein